MNENKNNNNADDDNAGSSGSAEATELAPVPDGGARPAGRDPLLADAERQAERIVARVRLATSVLFFLFMLAVYFGSSLPGATADLDRQLLIAVGTIAGYTALSVVSLWATRPGRFRLWMSWPFVFGDVLFCMIAVYLSLANLHMPGHFLTLTPAIWLVPIVLAFVMLRFNPALMAATVIMVVVSLAILTFVPTGSTSYSITDLELLMRTPPAAMRLLMIAVAGLVLVISARRARLLLARARAEADLRRNLTRYIPAEVADRLAEGDLDAMRRGKQRLAAIMFIDIRGFTSLSEWAPPEEVVSLLSEYRTLIVEEVERHNGVIDKFIGDGAMIAFGADREIDNISESAVTCALAILRRIEDWNRRRATAGAPAIRVGIGIHKGNVFVGAVGNDRRLEYAILGDSVNIASRLEELTKFEGVPLIISRSLQKRLPAEQKALFKHFPKAVLRGHASPVDIFGLRTNRRLG